MRKYNLSLKNKALIGIISILLPVTITFLIIYNQNRTYLKQRILDMLTVIAEAYEGQVYQFLEKAKIRAQDFASDGFIRTHLQKAIHGNTFAINKLNKHLVKNKLSLDKTINTINILSLEGRVVASTNNAEIGRDLSKDACFEEGRNAVAIVENRAGHMGLPEITISTPILTKETGRPVGVIINYILISELNKLLTGEYVKEFGAISWGKGKGAWKTLEMYLVNRDKLMITKSIFVEDAVLKQIVDTLPVNLGLTSNKEMTGFYKDYRGIEVVGVSMYFPSMKWVLLVEIDKDEVLAPVRYILINTLITAVVVMGIVVLIYIAFVKKIVKPLYTVSNAIKDIARDNIEIIVPVQTGDEIGTLCESFNSMSRDIKIRTTELKKSNERLAEAQQIAHVGNWEWDFVKNEAYWSDELYRIFGFAPQEFVVTYDAFLNRVHPDGRKFVKKSVDDALHGKKPYDIEFRIFHKDGSVRIIHEKGVVVSDHTGRVIRMVGTVQDITERKRAEEELITEQNKFLAVINAMEDGLTIQDLDYNIIYQNETIKNVFGVRLGEKCYSTYEGKNSICDGCPVKMVYKDGKSHVSERRVVLPSGEIAFYENIASPIIDASGKIVSCLEIARNITGRKQAEEEMHLLQTITMEISASKDLHEALIVTIRKVCDVTGWVYGEAWMLNPDGTLLERNHAYYSRNEGFEKFSAFTEGMTFPSGIGLPGRAWSKKQPMWIQDVTVDPYYLRAQIAGEAGLKTGIAFPITTDNEVVSVIVFYDLKTKEKDERIMQLVLTVLSQIGSIVKRKQAEDALRQSEEKLRSILDNATAVIYIKDVQGRYLFINKQFEKLFRLTRNAVKGETDFDLWSKEMAEAFQANDRRVIESKTPIEFEEAAPREDGLHTYISVKFPLFDSTGAVYAVCGISTDITRRKQMEDQLRTLSYTVEQSSVPIVITNTHGDIQYVNPTFTRLTGYSLKEAIGKNPRILKSGKTPPEIYNQLWDTITKGGEWQGEICNKKKNGELYWEYERISSIKDPMGRIANFVAIKEDITERKQMEEEQATLREQLYHAQKLESVGTLAGGIAHDFNNILTAIIGYGSLLQMELKEDAPSRDFVQKILNSAEKAANLTQGLLAFSRKQISNPRPVYLNEIIKGVESLLVRVMREDIKIKTTLTDKKCVLMADVGQMEQVLMNLATNARDAMPRGGFLGIITDIVEVDDAFIKTHGYGEVGRYALVSVSDTGEGMDEKAKERIFEPFFTTKGLGKGTGLGLAIVYGIIKQHNGYINVYSEPGKGTTFRIYLPLIEAEVEREKAEAQIIHKGGAETILIAEDDEDIRKLTKTVLEGHGYTVIEAVDGQDAVEKFSANKDKIHLLLFDIMMPNKNGREAYDAINEMKPGINAIFMSGYSEDIVYKKENMLGKRLPLIAKPVSPTELLKKMREALDK